MKRGRKDDHDAKTKPKKPPAKRGARKMPPPIPKGEILLDFTKKTSWVLGSSVGKGGFGEIYTATKSGSSKSEDYVIKIEPHENGPLFTELSFYRRVAKPSIISEWCQTRGLSYLSVPEFVAAGEHMFSGLKFRFMIMHRYGEDIEKKFTAAGRQFGIKTVCHLALRLLEALEFLHGSEYVHADVKGSNLLTGLAQPHRVYLVDYGLAYRYRPEGVCKDYSEDPRRKHDGTIEFTSIDAHNGANPSRRADLEILGYCLLQWAAGHLPWEGNLENKEYVAREKKMYKGDVRQLMGACFRGSPIPLFLTNYMKYVYELEFTQQPDYSKLNGLFRQGLKEIGCKDDGKNLDWTSPSRKHKPAGTDEVDSPVKKARVIRKPPVKRHRKVVPVEDDTPKASGGSDEVDLPVKKARIVSGKPPVKRHQKVAPVEDDTPKASGDSDEVDSPVKKVRVVPGKPPVKRRKAGSAVGDTRKASTVTGESSPPKPVDDVLSKPPKPVREKGMSKPKIKESPCLLPNACYPTQLGYHNGESTSAKKPPVKARNDGDNVEPVLRRSQRRKVAS